MYRRLILRTFYIAADFSIVLRYEKCVRYACGTYKTYVHEITIVPVYVTGYNDFVAATSHYKGHWKWWALKIKTFFGPEMATSEASAILAQKS
jgi:hypothetical protein